MIEKIAYLIKFNDELFYAEKQPHYQLNFTKELYCAKIYKNEKTAMKQINHILQCVKPYKSSMLYNDLDGIQNKEFCNMTDGTIVKVNTTMTIEEV